jgi:hypothetical protein
MREGRITTPELALIAGTRAALGLGLGLLLANRLTAQERRGAGWALFLVGVVTTIPLAIEVFGRPRAYRLTREPARRADGLGQHSATYQRQKAEFAFG